MTSPDLQIYPDEQSKIQYVYEKLSRQFEFTPIKGDSDKKIFEMAVHNDFGEIGFLVTVTWQQIHVKDLLTAKPTGVWLPGIEIYGRNKKEDEHDHDRDSTISPSDERGDTLDGDESKSPSLEKKKMKRFR